MPISSHYVALRQAIQNQRYRARKAGHEVRMSWLISEIAEEAGISTDEAIAVFAKIKSQKKYKLLYNPDLGRIYLND